MKANITLQIEGTKLSIEKRVRHLMIEYDIIDYKIIDFSENSSS